MMEAAYEFYELVVYDIHCQQIGRLLAKRRLESAIQDGLGIYRGLCFFGLGGEPNVHPDFGESANFGNLNMKPNMSTLSRCMPSTGGQGRVGHVLCDLEFLDGTKEGLSPRAVAQNQISQLLEAGLTIKSSSEVEFDVRDATSHKDFGHTAMWANIGVIEDQQGVFLELLDELAEVGVKVDTLQTEAGPGQYEITMDIGEGIVGPDCTVRFKNCVKTFFKKRGYTASFMTKVDLEGISSGMHFNHSLWTKDGANTFIDPAQPGKLSKLGRHWLAGLIEHGPGITALCSPTLNCYRRIGTPWAPTYSNWGDQDRSTTYRLKVEGQGRNVYLENRLPSSASNPYLVLACTVAAGLDGIRRKLTLPAENCCQVKLPGDLDSALDTLEADHVLVNALGKDFVKHFVYCKRTFEVEKVKGVSPSEMFSKEYEMYFYKA